MVLKTLLFRLESSPFMFVVDIVEREESSSQMAAIKLCLNCPMFGVLALSILS